MYFHDLLLGLLSFCSEVLGTLSGFGSSTFFIPAASFFESFRLVLVLTGLLHCFSNLSKIALFRKSMKWSLLFKLGIPSVLFTALGAALSNKIQVELIKKLLGVALIVIPSLKWAGVLKKNKISMTSGIALLAASGFLTGLVGTGGALRGLALSALQIEMHSFVLLSAAIDLGGDLIRTTIYLSNGYMDWQQWFYLPLLIAGAFAGSYVGKQILKRMNQSQFETIVGVFVFFSGLALLFS